LKDWRKQIEEWHNRDEEDVNRTNQNLNRMKQEPTFTSDTEISRWTAKVERRQLPGGGMHLEFT